MGEKAEVAKRRDFLKLASLGAIGGTAALGGSRSAEAAVEADTGSGYRETDHVKKVYELSKF